MIAGILFLLALSLGNAIVGFSSDNEVVAVVGKTLAITAGVLAILGVLSVRYLGTARGAPGD